MFIVEKLTEFPNDIFEELYISSLPYLMEALPIEEAPDSTPDDPKVLVRLEFDRTVDLKTFLEFMMKGQSKYIVIRNSADNRIQTLMSGEINSEGTLYSPYNLHNSDPSGSRAYLYRSQPDNAADLQTAFNSVGINNVRVCSTSDAQANHALATGWIEDTAPDETEKRTFRTPWGWE